MILELRLEEELYGVLQNPDSLKHAVSRGIKAAAEEYVEAVHDLIEAGRAFKSRTGQLEDSISWRPLHGARAEVFANAEHAPFVEFGTKPHTIIPRHRKALKIPTGTGYILRRKVNHPGSRSYPFMYADFDNRRARVIEAMRRTIAAELA